MSSSSSAKHLARMDWELTKQGLAMRRKRDEYESRVAREGSNKNSALYADDAFADDVATHDDIGTYNRAIPHVITSIELYEGGME